MKVAIFELRSDGCRTWRKGVKEIGVFEADGFFRILDGFFGSCWTVVGHERGSRDVLWEGPKALFAPYFSSF